MRLLHSRIDPRSNFNGDVVAGDRYRLNYRGEITAIDSVNGQSPVGGNDDVFHDLCRVEEGDVFRGGDGNSNGSWVFCDGELIIVHGAWWGVFGTAARIFFVLNRARGDRGFEYEDGVGA